MMHLPIRGFDLVLGLKDALHLNRYRIKALLNKRFVKECIWIGSDLLLEGG